MRKKIFTCSLLGITIVATASVLYSQVVLKTDMRSPDQVVQAGSLNSAVKYIVSSCQLAQ
jgi:hypothetical protein